LATQGFSPFIQPNNQQSSSNASLLSTKHLLTAIVEFKLKVLGPLKDESNNSFKNSEQKPPSVKSILHDS
jgi:hypothetical protein